MILKFPFSTIAFISFINNGHLPCPWNFVDNADEFLFFLSFYVMEYHHLDPHYIGYDYDV